MPHGCRAAELARRLRRSCVLPLPRFGQQGSGSLAFCTHAVGQLIILAAQNRARHLTERLDEVPICQIDMPAKFRGGAQTIGVVVASGLLPVTHADIGRVAQVIQLHHTVKIIAALLVQPVA